jgi:hypothetical protein
MKLNTYTKEAIIRAIMNDVPKPDQEKAKVDIQAAAVKAMSPLVRKVYKEQPKALKTYHIASYSYDFDYSFDVVCGDVDMAPILKPYAEAREQRRKAKHQLESAVKACNTLKQLEAALPEFKKYFPTEAQPTKNLPALANVVADLSKLGWPKGAKPQEKQDANH